MRIEAIDDLPLLGSELKHLDLAQLLDKHFPDHGLWQGITGGQLTLGWLLYILSEGDHRLSHVEDWASLRINTLRAILGTPELRQIDFSDDRLGRLLDRFSDDIAWRKFEQSLSHRTVEVYQLNRLSETEELNTQVIRTDSFHAPQFREVGELFGFGYSKHRRADQPFCKVMMASLDPLSLPMAVEVVKGSGPDTDHYLPLIESVKASLANPGNLYVGDSQLGSISNRASIHGGGDYYLCPLSRKQCNDEVRSTYLDQLPEKIESLPSIFTQEDTHRRSAYYFEIPLRITHQEASWEERRILVYAPVYAQGLIDSFNNRLNEAQQALELLVISKRGRRNPKTIDQLHARVAQLIKKYKVQGCFEISCSEDRQQYTVQKHKERKTETREKITLSMSLRRVEEIIKQKRRALGWQIYASNALKEDISADLLVKCYRNEFRIEHLFDYIINRDVGLLPIYLKKEHRVKALIRLLSIAMRCSALLQYQVRKTLRQEKTIISGIYPGNKGRKTDQPTTPMLLRAFKGIAIAWVKMGEGQLIQITPLSDIQNNILSLLKKNNLYLEFEKLLETIPDLRET
ncbi:MAG: transposase [Bacteroidota bacterium]